MSKSRLVYSTDSGRICTSCGNALASCGCKRKRPNKKTRSTGQIKRDIKVDGIIRIQRETKGRKGKTVTAIYGSDPDVTNLKELTTRLKSCCGTGGSVKSGIVLIQGDHRKAVQTELVKLGYTIKPAGG